MSQDDPLNPWGGPSERELSAKTVDLLLRLVDSGRGLASLMKLDDPQRYVRLESLWKWHRKAEAMIVNELGRRRRVANQLKQQNAELEAMPAVEEEDEDEEEEEDEEDADSDPNGSDGYWY